MAMSMEERMKKFEAYILDKVTGDMVFESMVRHYMYEPLFTRLDERVLHSFIKNELTSHVYTDFFKKELDKYRDEYDDWLEMVDMTQCIIYGPFRERVAELAQQPPETPAYRACMRLVRFMETDVVPTMTRERVFPLLPKVPHRPFVPPAIHKRFGDLAEEYYDAYGPARWNSSKRQFVDFMFRHYLTEKCYAFKERVNELERQYKAGCAIARAYRAYRLRYRLPLVALKSVTNDMIRYRPGTGIKFFEVSDFFENLIKLRI